MRPCDFEKLLRREAGGTSTFGAIGTAVRLYTAIYEADKRHQVEAQKRLRTQRHLFGLCIGCAKAMGERPAYKRCLECRRARQKARLARVAALASATDLGALSLPDDET